MKKAVFISYNQALTERVAFILDQLQIRGFTQWPLVNGAGTVDGEPRIFRDINSTDTTIPEEVLHFTAKVKEVNDGNLLVTYVSTAEGFLELSEGDYVVSKDNLQDEVQVGDTVEIWTNGIILETYPAQIGLAYRIEKVG